MLKKRYETLLREAVRRQLRDLHADVPVLDEFFSPRDNLCIRVYPSFARIRMPVKLPPQRRAPGVFRHLFRSGFERAEG